jgi:RNase P protein component
VRSRIRRIARDVYRGLVDELRMYDVLLAAREDVSTHRRQDLRLMLARIFQRATAALQDPRAARK